MAFCLQPPKKPNMDPESDEQQSFLEEEKFELGNDDV